MAAAAQARTHAAHCGRAGGGGRGGSRGGEAVLERVPVVLFVSDCPMVGHTWLLSGLPCSRVRLQRVPTSALNEEGKLRALLLSLCYQKRKPATLLATCLWGGVAAAAVACAGSASAAALRNICNDFCVALLADETRCSLGRCGALLTSPSCGLSPDLISIGDSLGGGYASVAAVVYNHRVFPTSYLPSTATMANDNLGRHVGLATLDELMGRGGRGEEIARAAKRFEGAVRAAVRGDWSPGEMDGSVEWTDSPGVRGALGLQEEVDFMGGKVEGEDSPGVRAADVFGMGLMLCIRYDGEMLSPLSHKLQTKLSQHQLPPLPCNLVLHAYLLRAHGVRTRPSGGAPTSIFVEPPAVISTESTARVCSALYALGRLVASADFDGILEGALGDADEIQS
ncbi:MAG: hypothetical protein SGPRY_002518 [Prymnesium sp.]